MIYLPAFIPLFYCFNSPSFKCFLFGRSNCYPWYTLVFFPPQIDFFGMFIFLKFSMIQILEWPCKNHTGILVGFHSFTNSFRLISLSCVFLKYVFFPSPIPIRSFSSFGDSYDFRDAKPVSTFHLPCHRNGGLVT